MIEPLKNTTAIFDFTYLTSFRSRIIKQSLWVEMQNVPDDFNGITKCINALIGTLSYRGVLDVQRK